MHYPTTTELFSETFVLGEQLLRWITKRQKDKKHSKKPKARPFI